MVGTFWKCDFAAWVIFVESTRGVEDPLLLFVHAHQGPPIFSRSMGVGWSSLPLMMILATSDICCISNLGGLMTNLTDFLFTLTQQIWDTLEDFDPSTNKNKLLLAIQFSVIYRYW